MNRGMCDRLGELFTESHLIAVAILQPAASVCWDTFDTKNELFV
jgi:hypothetical protein